MHHVFARSRADIRHAYFYRNLGVRGYRRIGRGRNIRYLPFEVGIRQPVTERVLHDRVVTRLFAARAFVPMPFRVRSLVPFVPDVDILGVDYVAGARGLSARIHIRRIVLHVIRLRAGKPARRIDVALENFGYGVCSALTRAVHIHRAVYARVVQKPEFHRVARVHYYDNALKTRGHYHFEQFVFLCRSL